MNKRSILDIVPLLDVILILLFVMMLNVGQNMMVLENNAASLEEELVRAEENIESLQEDLDKSKDELLNERMKTEQLITALSNLLREDEEVLEKLLDEMQLDDQAKLEDKLSEMKAKENLYEELIKYSIIANEITFIDINLKGDNNRIYLNDKETDLYLLFEEVIDDKKRIRKKAELKELIYEEIETQNNHPILFITIKVDSEVDRIAYLLLEEVIDGIELRYGSDKVIRAR